MARFLTGRLIESMIVLGVMSFVVYVLIGLMPGDPVDLMIAGDPKITDADVERLRQLYGLDRPIIERYGTWLSAALQGNFGYSRTYTQPVLDILWPRLGNTVLLMGLSSRVHARHRDTARRLRRAAALLPYRLRHQPVLLRRHFGAGLLVRPALHHPVRGTTAVAAGGRHGDRGRKRLP